MKKVKFKIGRTMYSMELPKDSRPEKEISDTGFSNFKIVQPPRYFTEAEEQYLRNNYENVSAQIIADHLNRPLRSVYQKANALGLKKSKEFVREVAKANALNNPNMAKTWFKKGHVPMNKGKHPLEYMSPEKYEKMQKTLFKKGNVPHNALNIGEERIYKDSSGRLYTLLKVPQKRNLIFKHVYVYEQAHGPVPEKHNVVFRNGDTMDIRLENLECISNAELMERNSIQRYPADLRDLMRITGRLKKAIKNKKDESE